MQAAKGGEVKSRRHAELVKAVLQLLHGYGFYAFPIKNAGTFRRSKDGREFYARGNLTPGVADVLGFRPPDGHGIAVEVKTGKDPVRPAQEAFAIAVQKCGVTYLVCRDTVDALISAHEKGQL